MWGGCALEGFELSQSMVLKMGSRFTRCGNTDKDWGYLGIQI